MDLSQSVLIYWCGLEPRNGTSVQLVRLLGPALSQMRHIRWSDAAGSSPCRSDVWLEPNDFWPLRRGARLWQWLQTKLFFWPLVMRGVRRRALKKYLQDRLNRTDVAYVVVYNEEQARYANDILQALGRPAYVLHLMDILEANDVGRLRTPMLRRLIRGAAQVIGISPELARLLGQLRGGMVPVIPPCTRLPAAVPAIPAGNGRELRIAIVGTIYNPHDIGGDFPMTWLARALAEMPNARLVYAGASSAGIPEELRDRLHDAGQLTEDAALELLSNCDAAFFTMHYRRDSAFRYSVPSRFADYLACGLPIVASAEPQTAVWSFLEPMQGRGVLMVRSAGELREVLQRLADDTTFREYQSVQARTYARRELASERWRPILLEAIAKAQVGVVA